MPTPNWAYFAPHRPELFKALRQLREQVFHTDEYAGPPDWYKFLAEREDVKKLREYLVIIYKDGAPEQVIFTGYSD